MTIAKLEMIRRLLLQILMHVEAELRERGAMPTIKARDIQHW